MTEERLQEIKDSIEFQYTLAKAKGYDNALLFTNEEEELVEEIERLQAELDKTRLSELDKEYTIDSNIKSYNKLAKYSDELEDRIEKAIRWVEITDDDMYERSNELLNILKGSDKSD